MKCDELEYEKLGDMMPFYPRSTPVIRKQFVDAAIDELKREHHRERHEYIEMVAKQRAEFFKRERRHKYKRCLAMARIAQDDWHLHNSFYAMGHQEFEKRKCEFYEKWRHRWLAIAEKFKPNSTAQ